MLVGAGRLDDMEVNVVVTSLSDKTVGADENAEVETELSVVVTVKLGDVEIVDEMADE